MKLLDVLLIAPGLCMFVVALTWFVQYLRNEN